MLLYTMLYIVLAYLMLFAALTNSVCLNNASFFFLFKYFLCQGKLTSVKHTFDVTTICAHMQPPNKKKHVKKNITISI